MNRFLTLGLLMAGFGGITGAGIININSLVNGEQIGNESCTITCNGALISPVQVTLGPGTYSFSDAWGQPGALYDAWNYSGAWGWHWKVLYDDGSAGSTINSTNYATYLIADVDPDQNQSQEYPTEAQGSALGLSTPPVVITLLQTTTLDFVVNDYFLPDNTGGISLGETCTGGACLGSTTAPEPSSWMMCAAAFVVAALLRRRRRSKTA